MKSKIATLTVIATVVALSLPVASQAQDYPAPTSTVPVPASASTSAVAEKHERRHKTFIGALKGGGIGCVAGGLFALLRHDNPVKGCLVAGAAGAVIGGVVAYKHQVKEAKELAAETRAAGGSAVLTTKSVNAKSDDGSTQQTEAMDKLTLNLDPAGVAEHTADTQAILTKAATIAKSSQHPVAITVYGNAEQREWMTEQLLATDPNVKIDSQYASKPSLVLAA